MILVHSMQGEETVSYTHLDLQYGQHQGRRKDPAGPHQAGCRRARDVQPMMDHERRRIAAYFNALNRRVAETDSLEYSGAIAQIVGTTVEAEGPAASIGDLCKISYARGGGHVLAEVEGFKENKVLLMPLGPVTGLSPGDRIVSTGFSLQVRCV